MRHPHANREEYGAFIASYNRSQRKADEREARRRSWAIDFYTDETDEELDARANAATDNLLHFTAADWQRPR